MTRKRTTEGAPDDRAERRRVLVKFCGYVAEVAGMLPHPARPRPFEEVWMEIEFLMPPHHRGGHTLFLHFGATMYKKFGGQQVTPTELRNFLKGRQHELSDQAPEKADG
ncbi:MAG TPA: hypothetical protein VF659_14575 [Pyrinomonadaceae bacterium]|jgi:hypothetical protein